MTALPFHSPETLSLRQTLGDFATGITVVTARGANGLLAGLTVNSFSSVSLEPPLVLWSLTLASPSLPVFESCTHYAVNVLGEGQRAISQCFAKTGIDKFAGIETRAGAGGSALLPGCVAWLECRVAARHAGGDHLIMVGEVVQFRRANGHPRPLLFHHGKYKSIGDEL